jgi:hypothetical protein
MIQRMEGENISCVVEIHLASFPGFFLPYLGARFLCIYNRICNAPEGIAYVYVDDAGSPAGFVAGTSDPRPGLDSVFLGVPRGDCPEAVCRSSDCSGIFLSIPESRREKGGGPVFHIGGCGGFWKHMFPGKPGFGRIVPKSGTQYYQ